MTVRLAKTFNQDRDDSHLVPDADRDDWYVRRILSLLPPNFPVIRRVIEEAFPASPWVRQEVHRVLGDLVKARVVRISRDREKHTDFYERRVGDSSALR